MSRFDGARQGWAVWLISLVVVVIAAIIGAVYGSEYDVMNRVDIPDVPIPTDDLTLGGAVTIAAAIFATLVAALAGGKAGRTTAGSTAPGRSVQRLPALEHRDELRDAPGAGLGTLGMVELVVVANVLRLLSVAKNSFAAGFASSASRKSAGTSAVDGLAVAASHRPSCLARSTSASPAGRCGRPRSGPPPCPG